MNILHRFILLVLYIAPIVVASEVDVNPVVEEPVSETVVSKEEVNNHSPEEVVPENTVEKVTEESVPDMEAADVNPSPPEEVVVASENTATVTTSTKTTDDCTSTIDQLQANLEACQSKSTSTDATITNLTDQLSQTTQSLQKCTDQSSTTLTKVETLIKERDALIESLASSKMDIQKCKGKVATCLSDHNEALQQLASLQEKNDRIKRIQDATSKELHKEIKSLKSDIHKSKESHKRLQDRYHDEREKVHDLEKELRQMHHAALNSYVNTTLLVEDAMYFLSKNIDRMIFATENIMAREDVRNVQQMVNDRTSPALSFANQFYSTHAAPHVESLQRKLRDVNIVEGTRLFLIALVEQVGKTGSDYLELTSTSRRGGRSRVRTIIVKKLKYAKSHGELIVDRLFSLCIMYVAYKVGTFFLFGLTMRCRRGVKGKDKTE